VFSGLAVVHGVIGRPLGAGEQVCMRFVVYRVAFGWVLLAVSLFSRENAPNAQLPSSVTNPNILLPTGSLSCLSEATASLRNHPLLHLWGPRKAEVNRQQWWDKCSLFADRQPLEHSPSSRLLEIAWLRFVIEVWSSLFRGF
jgi:hypothetical protein